ncbi:carbohydrate ABC transporter substrate-binding protein [Bacillus sp. FJAT-49870]|uniref:Probable sugar-binding periplasmic protein n=2 Tax=Lederbergia citri TaxID=2833580 RepID=A0A942TGE5_9BACI|nr:carbohydrate ABC transporter substrate-binding protein [Lederbergia citri]
MLAACGGNQTADEPAEPAENNDPPAEKPADKEDEKASLEIFSWWTGAGEEEGLLALIDVFNEKHPEIEVINAAVAGGAGTNAKAVLVSRMQGGDPPSTFQVHGGAELNESWVAAGKMTPLNDFFDAEGLNDKFPQELIDLVSKDGNIYSVPVNIHRGNVLWYNQKVFDDLNLKAPTTFDEFFKVADTLKKNGITPLAFGDKEAWTATHLYETVLLGHLGAAEYGKLWTGDLSFDDAKVKEATEIFAKMLDYVNEDHSARNWQDASQLVADGEAAMNVMGDWAKGYFDGRGLKVGTDYGWAPTPSSGGMFVVITDTFGLPNEIDNPETVKEFLSVLASVEGQDAFNPKKGSIPARVDADASKYDEYGKAAMEDFKTNDLGPSLAHGSAANEGFVTKVNDAMVMFVTQKNVDHFIEQLVAAAKEL